MKSSPSLGTDGTVYVGSNDNYLYAITSSGTLKWRYLTGDYVWANPTIGADGTVYVGSWDYYFYAITSSGNLKWRYRTGNIIVTSAAIGSDGTLYVGSYDDYLYAITTQTAPTTFPSMVISTMQPSMYGTALIDGDLQWRYLTGYHIQ